MRLPVAKCVGRVRFSLTLPAVFYLAVSIPSPLNIGVRHVLPLFPFVFALAGRALDG
jgi:hypothetical protein